MNKIILASNNLGKTKEIESILSPINYQIIPQSAFQILSAAETGLSFVENALIKARHASRLSGLPAIADDSGLMVDALCGAPGIYSARYAGDNATDDDNIRKLLAQLANEDNRLARFYCVIVYLRTPNDPTPLICEGAWQGSILKTPEGSAGFGYDPIFYLADQGCSAAKLPLSLKNTISHRAKALKSLCVHLQAETS